MNSSCLTLAFSIAFQNVGDVWNIKVIQSCNLSRELNMYICIYRKAGGNSGSTGLCISSMLTPSVPSATTGYYTEYCKHMTFQLGNYFMFL